MYNICTDLYISIQLYLNQGMSVSGNDSVTAFEVDQLFFIQKGY